MIYDFSFYGVLACNDKIGQLRLFSMLIFIFSCFHFGVS